MKKATAKAWVIARFIETDEPVSLPKPASERFPRSEAKILKRARMEIQLGDEVFITSRTRDEVGRVTEVQKSGGVLHYKVHGLWWIGCELYPIE